MTAADRARTDRRGDLVQRLTAALEPLLGESPYADLSVERLVGAAGVSRSTFYNHFADKADLLLAATHQTVADMARAADRWFDLPPDATFEDLRAVLREIAATYREHRLLLKSIVEGAAAAPAVGELYADLVAASQRGVLAQIESGQRAGAVDPGLAPGPTARLLTLLGEQALYRYVAIEDVTDDARFPDPLAAVYWRVLYEGHR